MVDFAAKLKALAEKAAEYVDQTVAQTGGGGDYNPPPAGKCKLRLVAYVELGKQKEMFQGKPRVKDKVQLVYELSGKGYEPVKLEDGTLMPHRITVIETLSLNEKANFFKLFTRMNYAGKAKHMAQLVGDAYRGEVVHRKYAKKGESKDDPSKWTGIAVELKNKDGYTIVPPRVDIVDEDGNITGQRVVPVDPPISQLRMFVWNLADKESWDSLFIDGEYPERKDKDGKVTAPAKSKNVIQNKIKLADNFKGSPIYTVLAAAGANLDIPDAEDGHDPADEGEDDSPINGAPASTQPTVPTGAAADDALNGIV
jgi:hypothetical protein